MKRYHRHHQSETTLDPDFSHLLVAKTASLPARRRLPKSVPNTPPGTTVRGEREVDFVTSASASSGLNREPEEEDEEEEKAHYVTGCGGSAVDAETPPPPRDDSEDGKEEVGLTKTSVSMPNMSQKKDSRRRFRWRRGSNGGMEEEEGQRRRLKVKSKDVCVLQ